MNKIKANIWAVDASMYRCNIKAAGNRTSLVTDKTFNPLANHGLDPLIRAMEKKRENPAINVIAKDL